jgi:hypothetical protein
LHRKQVLTQHGWEWEDESEVEAANGYAVLAALADAQADQAVLVRDVFGNPFQPVKLDTAWRTPTVLALAERAYEERELPSGSLDASLLAVLADALEDAGCDNEEMLSHLRQEGAGHVRGCWAVDAVLGKG